MRAHEQAHLSSAGQYAQGGAAFQYEVGPDGKQYAVGGEVRIDVSEESTPEATLQKAEVIQRAALAPADPSAQDLAVAARASRMAFEARRAIDEQSVANGGAAQAAYAASANDGSGQGGGHGAGDQGAGEVANRILSVLA